MTSNQIANSRAMEEARSNRANEKIKRKANKIAEYDSKTKRGSMYIQGAKVAVDSGAKMAGLLNDPAWYMKNKTLVNALGTLSFSERLGDPLPNEGYPDAVADHLISAAGVMAIRYMPTIGISKDTSSPINVIARDLYAFIRHENSGHANYEPVDYMLYLLAVDNAYHALAEISRLVKLAQKFSVTNGYANGGACFAAAYGLTLQQGKALMDDIRKNYANVRATIALWISQLRALRIPKGQTATLRHQWLASNVFADGNAEKSQLYFYACCGFYRYIETAGAGKLEYFPIQDADTNKFSTWTSISGYMNNIVTLLMESEDIGIMSGDTLKAFGDDGCYTIGDFDESFEITYGAVEPLQQIKNTTFIPGDLVVNSADITQNKGALIYQPKFQWQPYEGYTKTSSAAKAITDEIAGYYGTVLITREGSGAGSIEENLVFTRNCSTYTVSDVSASGVVKDITVTSCGSELFINAVMVRIDTRANANELKYINGISILTYNESGNVTFEELVDQTTVTGMLSCFAYHPRFMTFSLMVNKSANVVVMSSEEIHWDIANYAYPGNELIALLHTAALYSEYGVDRSSVNR